MKKTRISFDVELDENKVPEKITWSAPDGGVSNEKSKAIFYWFFTFKTDCLRSLSHRTNFLFWCA